MSAAVASVDAGQRFRWGRLLRLALTGLVAGAVLGFLGALLRPRSWVPYVEAGAASRS